MAQVNTLRVYISVPQAYTPLIKVGLGATLVLQEFPGQKFSGRVARTAESIDPVTRTLLTEVDVPNSEGKLLPGSFGQVYFTVGADVQKLTVPVSTVLFRAEGARVAVISRDGRVRLCPLSIGHDYGTTLEVLGGLTAADQVVANPPDSLEEGQRVKIVPSAPQAGGAR
jgi:RND family efflux transporter MFP subunit